MDDKDKMRLLENDNNTYIDQFKTIDIKIKYYTDQIEAYSNISNRKLNFKKFSQHVNDLTKPKGKFDVLLRNFYFYIITHIDINQIKSDYSKVVEENNALKMENKILKKLFKQKKF